MGITRSQQKAETIYVEPNGEAFFTVDGEGRDWYDSLTALSEEYSLDDFEVVYLDAPAEDF